VNRVSGSQKSFGRSSFLTTLFVIIFSISGSFISPLVTNADPSPTSGPVGGGTTVADVMPDLAFTVAGGVSTGYALSPTGSIYAWGGNYFGELGNGSVASTSSTPVKVDTSDLAEGFYFTAVAGGAYTGYGLGSDGLIYAWGRNQTGDSHNGQLGNGTTTNSSVPVKVETPTGVQFKAIAGSGYNGYGLTTTGEIYAWGDNFHCQLGNNSPATNYSLLPVEVSTANRPSDVVFTSIATGEWAAYGIGSDGRIYAWGWNWFGQLGFDSGWEDACIPTAVDTTAIGGMTFSDVASGAYTTYGLGVDGKIYSWGHNDCAQLGDGSSIAETVVPVEVPSPAGVTFVAVAAGAWSGLGLGNNGQIYGWGDNWDGQLGIGNYDGDVNTGYCHGVLAPVEAQSSGLPTGVKFVDVASGFHTTYAQGSDGKVYAWGESLSGQLGNGSMSWWPLPVEVQLPYPQIVSVYFGDEEGLALEQAGTKWTADTPGGCGPVDVTVTYTLEGETKTETYTDGFVYGSPPERTVEPESAVLPAGGGIFTTTAEANGNDDPTIQWQQQLSDGTWEDIDGSVSTELSLTVTKTTWFRAVFSNCWVTNHLVEPVIAGPVEVQVLGGGPDPRFENGGGVMPAQAPLTGLLASLLAGLGLAAVVVRRRLATS